MTMDFETGFCKGKRTAMEFFAIWLKEHAATARSAIEDEIPPERVLHRTLESMEVLKNCLDEKLEKEPEILSGHSHA